MFRTIVAAIALLAGAGTMLAQQPAKERNAKNKMTTTTTATGEFAVKMLPPVAPAVNDGFTRLELEKTFQGELEGTSHVTMMATSDGKSPSGGYVALERFTGKLGGKNGSFVMQHSGIMAPGMMEIHVLVSPGSGTGELTGIEGTLEIRIDGKKHFYTLQYRLPAQ